MKKGYVSIIIPTKNSSLFLDTCLASIHKQTYKKIEIIIVDGNSTDKTVAIGKKYNAKIYTYTPRVPQGIFDAPHKRNYGVEVSSGEYVYYVDADMELTEKVVEEAVNLCQQGFSGITIPEDSFGEGIWAQAKNLERRCYWGDISVEAPRFFQRKVWQLLGGLDESIGGGGDDWDLREKLLEKGFRIGRVNALVLHNEGKLSLLKLMKKRFMYGKESLKYIVKRPTSGTKSYFPIRMAYIRNWRLFLSRPVDSLFFVLMRTAEYFAGFSGMMYSLIKK